MLVIGNAQDTVAVLQTAYHKLESLYSWKSKVALVKAMAVWPDGKLRLFEPSIY
jgi:hypothetical protein